MKKNVIIKNVGKFTLSDNNFVASGGEASIYKNSQYAIKIYHEPRKAIPEAKIDELSKISASNVCKPLYTVYDATSQEMLGYCMQFIDQSHPICKLFTKTFRDANNIKHTNILDIIKKLQNTVTQIHRDQCLIVDLNEMNLLVSGDFQMPLFIDVDSYQTKSFPATAIMDSIRDPLVKGVNWTEESDWFSFAIIAFQLYIGIHPYKGKHPKYKPNQWLDRMKDGVSALNKSVSLPSVCNDISVIPKRHLDWMNQVFEKRQRLAPPDLDSVIPIVAPVQMKILKSTNKMNLTDIFVCSEPIKRVYSFIGVKWYISEHFLWKDGKKIRDIDSNKRTYLCKQGNGTLPILVQYDKKSKHVVFEDINSRESIAKIDVEGVFESNSNIYSMQNGAIYFNKFTNIGNKTLHSLQQIAQVSCLSSKIMPNLIYQNLLGKPWFVIPTATGVLNGTIKEVEGYKILNARFFRNIAVIIAEKNGRYDKFIAIFDMMKSFQYSIRKIEDVNYEDVNFTVLDNGMCLNVKEDSDIELFRDNSTMKVIENTSISSDTPLYSFDNKVYIVNDKCFTQITMK